MGTLERKELMLLTFLSFYRFITIMVYLKEPEEGGETAFPAADNITYSESVSIFSYNTEVYSEPYRASKIDRFAKIVNNLMPVAIFEKRSSLEA